MAKKESTKAATASQTAQAATAGQPAQKKINFLTLKHWATGTINQTGEPLLMIESMEGPHIGVRLSGQSAIDMAKALLALGEKQIETTGKAN